MFLSGRARLITVNNKKSPKRSTKTANVLESHILSSIYSISLLANHLKVLISSESSSRCFGFEEVSCKQAARDLSTSPSLPKISLISNSLIFDPSLNVIWMEFYLSQLYKAYYIRCVAPFGKAESSTLQFHFKPSPRSSSPFHSYNPRTTNPTTSPSISLHRSSIYQQPNNPNYTPNATQYLQAQTTFKTRKPTRTPTSKMTNQPKPNSESTIQIHFTLPPTLQARLANLPPAVREDGLRKYLEEKMRPSFAHIVDKMVGGIEGALRDGSGTGIGSEGFVGGAGHNGMEEGLGGGATSGGVSFDMWLVGRLVVGETSTEAETQDAQEKEVSFIHSFRHFISIYLHLYMKCLLNRVHIHRSARRLSLLTRQDRMNQDSDTS